MSHSDPSSKSLKDSVCRLAIAKVHTTLPDLTVMADQMTDMELRRCLEKDIENAVYGSLPEDHGFKQVEIDVLIDVVGVAVQRRFPSVLDS